MKTIHQLLLVGLLLGTPGFAAERSIRTRDGKIFTKAEITEVGAASVKIVHDGGIAVVALENLPTAIQKEVGYKTVVDRQLEAEQAAQGQQLQDTMQSQGRDEARKAAKEKRLKAALFATATATPAEANAFAGMTPEAVREKFGEPVRVVHTAHAGGGATTFF